jgi:hypothetical protein
MQPQALQVGVIVNNVVDLVLTPETEIIIGKYWNSTLKDIINKNAKYYKGSSTNNAKFEKLSI